MSRLNPKIYPNWWRDESKEDDFANSFSKPQKDYRKQRAEQEVSSQFYIENPLEYKLKSKSKERSKTPNRIKYVSEHTRLSTNPNKFKEDLKYTESKIRTNVLYDKKIHKQLKKRRNLYPDAKEWKYDDYLQSNNIQAEYNEEDRRTQGDNKRRPKIDYMISYDKELKPELIRQKSRERNAYTGKERRNQVIINQNKEENKDHQAKSNVQTGNFSQENFNRTNDVSFKRSNREQEQSEKLSSYAPSERNASKVRSI